jgi:hypothetical protein
MLTTRLCHMPAPQQGMQPEDALLLVNMHRAAGRARPPLTFVICHSEPGGSLQILCCRSDRARVAASSQHSSGKPLHALRKLAC